MAKRRKGHSLKKRYGHFAMKDMEEVSESVRRMARTHPELTGAAIGATAAAISAGLGPATAAIVGAVTGAGAAIMEKKR